jgi:hypothetical protein
MELRVQLELPCEPPALAPWVDDLSAYPEWMGLVHRAVRQPGDEPAWAVDLRGRLGPLARSKRLRMVRTTPAGPGVVRFERRELDGRSHGHWELTANYDARGSGTAVDVVLHYDGSMWTSGLLERALHDQIEQAKERLRTLVSEGRVPGGGPTH